MLRQRVITATGSRGLLSRYPGSRAVSGSVLIVLL